MAVRRKTRRRFISRGALLERMRFAVLEGENPNPPFPLAVERKRQVLPVWRPRFGNIVGAEVAVRYLLGAGAAIGRFPRDAQPCAGSPIRTRDASESQ